MTLYTEKVLGVSEATLEEQRLKPLENTDSRACEPDPKCNEDRDWVFLSPLSFNLVYI